MEQFDAFVSKHGEQGVQAILENWERFCGVSHGFPLSLERRWEIFMRETSVPARMAA